MVVSHAAPNQYPMDPPVPSARRPTGRDIRELVTSSFVYHRHAFRCCFLRLEVIGNMQTGRVATLKHIKNLINCLVNIKDETGEFLLTLEDGRVIDTKGWNDWEWTHGIGYMKFNLVPGKLTSPQGCMACSSCTKSPATPMPCKFPWPGSAIALRSELPRQVKPRWLRTARIDSRL